MPGKGAGPRCLVHLEQLSFRAQGSLLAPPSHREGLSTPSFQVLPSRGRCSCKPCPTGVPWREGSLHKSPSASLLVQTQLLPEHSWKHQEK